MLSLEESGCADEISRRRAVSRRRLVSEVIFFFLRYIFFPNFDFHCLECRFIFDCLDQSCGFTGKIMTY